MPLRAFEDVPYIPLLSIKPAEMSALEELPDPTKDLLFPSFFLRPWLAARQLDSALGRIEQAYPDRPYLIEWAGYDGEPDNRRPVHDALDELREAHNGFENWCAFIADRENLVPVLQLADLAELPRQAERFAALGRGIAVRFPQETFGFTRPIMRRLREAIGSRDDICVILDFARQDRFLLNRVAEAVGYIQGIRAEMPHAYIAPSATSFPDSFGAINDQEIFERSFFIGISLALPDASLIYSDRGSARAEALGGGGGEIPPRIDYAGPNQWSFFRSDGGDRPDAYQAQAQAAMDHPAWDEDLHIWGTQMIERTALGDAAAITSQARAAAARINIHLHRQTFFEDSDVYDTDEDWTD